MARLDWASVQTRLHGLGFDPGPIDGIRGRRTMRAVKRFQESRGLDADGIAGPATVLALFGEAGTGDAAAVDRMPWYHEALRLVGTKEIEGPASNRDILEMADRLDLAYDNDDIPWCGLFAGHCVGASLPDEVLPTVVLRARAWEAFGVPTTPQLGAVMVFWRRSPDSGLGHVGFYFAEDERTYHILGGNQSDRVSVARLRKDRLLTARWPITALAPEDTVVTVDGSAAGLSTDES